MGLGVMKQKCFWGNKEEEAEAGPSPPPSPLLSSSLISFPPSLFSPSLFSFQSCPHHSLLYITLCSSPFFPFPSPLPFPAFPTTFPSPPPSSPSCGSGSCLEPGGVSVKIWACLSEVDWTLGWNPLCQESLLSQHLENAVRQMGESVHLEECVYLEKYVAGRL